MNDNLKFITEHFQIGELVEVSEIKAGIINKSYLIKDHSESKFVLQKLHKVFSYELLEDFKVVTNYLDKGGLKTPKIVPTKNGNLGFVEGENIWRVITFIPGTTLSSGITADLAESASSLVGSFHNKLSGLKYKFKHELEDFHCTEKIIARLEKVNTEECGSDKNKELENLSKKVIAEYEVAKSGIGNLPNRIIHGDLKLNNVRFDQSSNKAVSIVDLDTVGKNKIFYDIGDVVRSWCGTNNNRLDEKLFESVFEGYFKTASFLIQEEKLSLYSGIKILILELCARYIIDAYEEDYFNLDSSRYYSLYEQNKSKLYELYSFYEDFKNKKEFVESIVNKYL